MYPPLEADVCAHTTIRLATPYIDNSTMTTVSYRAQYRGAAASIILQMLLLFAGFSLLAAVFEFPEIPRHGLGRQSCGEGLCIAS
jgi:hypothetical protein